jgi:uncharacterized membrane protein
MISTKDNKNSTFILYLVSLLLLFILFYFLFNQFALANLETKKDNNSIKDNTTLKVSPLKRSYNKTYLSLNYFILQTVKLPVNI